MILKLKTKPFLYSPERVSETQLRNKARRQTTI